MAYRPPAPAPAPMHAAASPVERPGVRKGDLTRVAIVEAALAMAGREGLEGLTIGALAAQMGMSKSGVFAHFGSREDLQLAVLNAYAARFVDLVLRPAVRQSRGLPRLQAILERWLVLLAEEVATGCLLIGGASEYDDRPGPLREALVQIVAAWKAELVRALEQARDCGHLRPDIDCEQAVFEIYATMLMLHHDARLMHGRDSIARARSGLQRILAVSFTAHNGSAGGAPRRRAAAGSRRSHTSN